MNIIEPGHVYALDHLESDGTEYICFIKRSSGAVDYGSEEHPGTNTQEVLRALIDRSLFLNQILPCKETTDAINHLRYALWLYEVRAYRRKQAKVNKRASTHISPESYRDVPFGPTDIESIPTGSDGHLLIDGD